MSAVLRYEVTTIFLCRNYMDDDGDTAPKGDDSKQLTIVILSDDPSDEWCIVLVM